MAGCRLSRHRIIAGKKRTKKQGGEHCEKKKKKEASGVYRVECWQRTPGAPDGPAGRAKLVHSSKRRQRKKKGDEPLGQKRGNGTVPKKTEIPPVLSDGTIEQIWKGVHFKAPVLKGLGIEFLPSLEIIL